MSIVKLNLIVVGIVVALTAGFAFGLLVPGLKRLDRVYQDMSQKAAAVEEEQKQAGNVSDVYASILRINEQMADFHKRLPQDRQFGEFLNELSDHLKKGDITEYSVQPRPARQVDQTKLPKELDLAKGTVILPVSLSFETSFTRLFEFLQSLQAIPRLFHVESMSVFNDETQPGRVRVEMVLQTYHRPG
jgi:Tfp pilus assembly protein PilO